MYKEFNDFQKLKVLLLLVAYADQKGDVSFSNEMQVKLYGFFNNRNTVDYMLYQLNEDGVINYEEIGEDGFKPIVFCSISDKTHSSIMDLVCKMEGDFEFLNERVHGLFTFNHKKLLSDIEVTNRKISEIEVAIKNNDVLKPLEKTVGRIKSSFESVSNITRNYDDIYKSVIKPIQDEGRSGVKATVKWAVISIIASTILSWAVTNYANIITIKNNASVNVSDVSGQK
ncbi:TPA: hypothetical protein LTW68_001445 [Enterobacter hormaechei]|nr:hypothetical protein [Enterobacter hormaechei]